MSYDMGYEWDRYQLRYGGYSEQTLGEFLDRGIATYDETTDSYTITPDNGRPPFTVTNDFS